MPSEIAQSIVNHIFSDEKSKAMDAANDAFSAAAYDAIQQQKVEFAKQMGFELDDTAQSVADDLEDKVVSDGDEGEPKVEPETGRMPHEAPANEIPDEVEQPEASAEPTEEQPVEEPQDETNS
tara:strand:+ start:480 stop:848 length:369 start_codon:yes stop_codon:yes gene_type:complete